jgi:hypothetical protein
MTSFRVGFWLARLANVASGLASLWCFNVALRLANPDAPALLARRFLTLPAARGIVAGYLPAVSGLPAIHVPNVATWPLQAAWLLAAPSAHQWQPPVQALTWAAAGVALLVLCGWLSFMRQDYRNRSGKLAIGLFVAATSLNLFDLAHIVFVPLSWDNAIALSGVSKGALLRGAEVIASFYLLSLTGVLAANAVRADLFGPLGNLMRKVRWSLTIRLAVIVMVLPYLVGATRYLLGQLNTVGLWGARCGVVLELVVVALVVVRLADSPIRYCVELLDYIWQVSKVRPLAVPPPPAPPPPPPL